MYVSLFLFFLLFAVQSSPFLSYPFFTFSTLSSFSSLISPSLDSSFLLRLLECLDTLQLLQDNGDADDAGEDDGEYNQGMGMGIGGVVVSELFDALSDINADSEEYQSKEAGDAMCYTMMRCAVMYHALQWCNVM